MDVWRAGIAHARFTMNKKLADEVGEWVERNQNNHNFALNGLPPWFPTRSLDEWLKVRAMWGPYVFRAPEEKMARPRIPFTQKGKKTPNRKPAASKQEG